MEINKSHGEDKKTNACMKCRKRKLDAEISIKKHNTTNHNYGHGNQSKKVSNGHLS
jgi:hypothetical protein